MCMLTRNTMINHGIWGWGSSIVSDPPSHCLACQQTHCQACKAHKAQRSWKMMCCSPRASCSLAKSCNVWVEKVGHFSGMLSSKSMSRKMCGIERRKDGFAHGLSKQQKYGKLLEQTNQIWGWIKISIAFNIYLSRQSYY